MKSPKCQECNHAMSEHGPDGCKWCNCRVPGSFEKPWEADGRTQIAIVLENPRDERLLRSLHSGRDEFSGMRRPKLLERVPGGEAHSDAVLRWICRGLTPDLAIRKVRLDNEMRSYYAIASEKGLI